MYYFIISVLTLIYLYLNKQSVKNWIFINFHFYIYPHKEFAKWFGIRFERSDVWETSRKESYIAGFDFFIFQLFGIQIRASNVNFDHIKDLRSKLNDKTDEVFNFFPYIKKGETYDWKEFEKKMIDIVYEETFRMYDIPRPKDKKQFLEAILVIRNVLSFGGIYGKSLLLTKIGVLIPLLRYFKSSTYAEQMIALTPFMTVVDYAMYNLRDQKKDISYSERLQTIHHSFPLKYIPMLSNGEMVFCEVFVDKKNNNSNSMFGPKGMKCPGGMFVKSMTNGFTKFIQEYDYKVKRMMKNGKEEIIFCF